MNENRSIELGAHDIIIMMGIDFRKIRTCCTLSSWITDDTFLEIVHAESVIYTEVNAIRILQLGYQTSETDNTTQIRFLIVLFSYYDPYLWRFLSESYVSIGALDTLGMSSPSTLIEEDFKLNPVFSIPFSPTNNKKERNVFKIWAFIFS